MGNNDAEGLRLLQTLKRVMGMKWADIPSFDVVAYSTSTTGGWEGAPIAFHFLRYVGLGPGFAEVAAVFYDLPSVVATFDPPRRWGNGMINKFKVVRIAELEQATKVEANAPMTWQQGQEINDRLDRLAAMLGDLLERG